MTISAIALFCEDIREEKAGTETLIGVMPSTLSVPSFPSGVPKLGIYCRVQFPVSLDDFAAEAFLTTSWGQRFAVGGFGQDLTAQAKSESMTIGLSFASVIIKGLMVPMPFPEPGRFEFILKIGHDERVCGALGIIPISNASEPPSGLAPPSAVGSS
jgi:hypothetical protein